MATETVHAADASLADRATNCLNALGDVAAIMRGVEALLRGLPDSQEGATAERLIAFGLQQLDAVYDQVDELGLAISAQDRAQPAGVSHG